MTKDQAIKKAAEVNANIVFTDIREGETRGTYHGDHGVAYPCGCVLNNTVLTDGSIGWGEWLEECEEHFYAKIYGC